MSNMETTMEMDEVLRWLEAAWEDGYSAGLPGSVPEATFTKWLSNYDKLYSPWAHKEKLEELAEAKARVAQLEADLSAEARCQNCSGQAEPLHTCPYAEDINNDRESLCNCCDDCQVQCCQDI